MNLFRVRLFIFLMATLSILTVNIYLPALPLLERALHTNNYSIGLTVSFYMLGLAIGIPLYGAISDHITKHKVLVSGLVIFIFANILAFIATNILTLLIARFVQGVGAAAALCLWQVFAVTYFREKAKHIIASGFIIIGSMPALAPIIGGVILSIANWRIIFVFLIILTMVIILLACTLPDKPFQETRVNKQLVGKKVHFISFVLGQYKVLVLDKTFMILTLSSAIVYSSIYMYLSQVPFLLNELHYQSHDISLFFIPISVAFILGGILTKTLLHRDFPFKWLFLICVVGFVIGFIIALLEKLVHIKLSGFYIILPFFIMTFGSGLLMSVLVSNALSLQAARVGTAASAIGVIQNLSAFIFSGIGAYLTKYHYNGLIITYGTLFVLLTIGFVLYCKWHRQLLIQSHLVITPIKTNDF